MIRYYKNNFSDGFRQVSPLNSSVTVEPDCPDRLTGSWDILLQKGQTNQILYWKTPDVADLKIDSKNG